MSVCSNDVMAQSNTVVRAIEIITTSLEARFARDRQAAADEWLMAVGSWYLSVEGQ